MFIQIPQMRFFRSAAVVCLGVWFWSFFIIIKIQKKVFHKVSDPYKRQRILVWCKFALISINKETIFTELI